MNGNHHYGINEVAIRDILNEIVDPCSRIAGVSAGLDDLGLVTSVALNQGTNGTDVRVSIGLTEAGCLMGPAFIDEAKKRLTMIEGVGEVEVELDPDPNWRPERMRPTYRIRLEASRAASASRFERTLTTPRTSDVVKQVD